MQPEPISSIIRRILAGKGLSAGVKQGEVLIRWEEIVGDRIAQNAEAYAIESGILFLKVPDSTWRNELALMKESLVEKVNTFFGEERITRIHLI